MDYSKIDRCLGTAVAFAQTPRWSTLDDLRTSPGSLGNQARVSDDHGKTWSPPILISSDGVSGDLGYPSTVECDDGTMVTVWYEVLAGSPLAQLRQARWRLKS